MFTRILVPLDRSELAERALPGAERLAQQMGATLHLVRVIEPPPSSYGYVALGYDDLVATETTTGEEYLQQLRERLVSDGLSVHTRQLFGYAAGTLLDYERDAGIDLVVMCSHGRGGLPRFALGSVAERLLRHGTAPVLLVRAFGAPLALHEAVVPLDGSALAEKALPLVDQLAHGTLREVTLLRAVRGQGDGPAAEHYLKEAAQHLHQEHLACRRLVVQGEPAQAIVAAAGQDKLVIMATHGRGGLTRWALGSVADRVAHGGVAGLLLARAGSQASKA